MSEADSLKLFGGRSHAGEAAQADLVVSVGGDGSVLRAAQAAAQADLPLLGINSGRLGYLCALEMNELPGLDETGLNSLWAEPRTMLSIRLNGQTHLALNDVVIARRRLAGTLSASVTRDTETLLDFRGDGLIVATPTGSTAYSRSAGGPVLTPDSGCFSLTPICAHTPGTAPIVVPDRFAYRVSVFDTGEDAADVLADGVTMGSLTEPLMICRHERPLRLLRRKGA
ncbi:MAG: NAD(+)/NADH kinase [Clostridia bacterium]|nr:NAD(+)/NADH kinase [Clostridia bacterium]